MLTLENLMLVQDDFSLRANWSVPSGARLALIGPSGSGKSTLLLAIAGLFAATAGRILWNGQDMATLSPGDRPLSMLFQDQNLFPHLTLRQNLGLGLMPNLRLSADHIEQIENALMRVGLAGFSGRKPAQLSGGQLARAALARALLRARPLLLLDEPFAALGPALKADMLGLLDEVATATAAAVLLVTHDPTDAKRFADHTVLVVDHVAQSPVETAQLFASPPPALLDYLG